MEAIVTGIDRLSGNDTTLEFTMRYRLAVDPDVIGSYTTVVTTKNALGVLFPFLDITTLAPDDYILHTYFTASGDTTGTKVAFTVSGAV